MAVAIELLGLFAIKDDINVVRSYLKDVDPGIRISAIKALANIGEESDFEALLEIASQANNGTSVAAAAAIVSRFSGNIEMLGRLLARGSPEAVATVMQKYPDDKAKNLLPFVKPLLHSENSRTRIKAIAFTGLNLPRAEIPKFIDEYILSKRYYYHVVAWLDRFAHAPVWLLDAYYRNADDEIWKLE